MKRNLLLTIFIISFHFCFSQIWKPLGQGLPNIGAYDFINYNNQLYVGGTFSSVTSNLDNIGSWDGTDWNPVGPGMLGGVYGLTVYNGDLIAGGGFQSIPGVPYTRKVARWDGTNWHPLNYGVTQGQVNATIVYNGSLYIGGNFYQVDSMPIRALARWDGTSWNNVCTFNSGSPQVFSMANYISVDILVPLTDCLLTIWQNSMAHPGV